MRKPASVTGDDFLLREPPRRQFLERTRDERRPLRIGHLTESLVLAALGGGAGVLLEGISAIWSRGASEATELPQPTGNRVPTGERLAPGVLSGEHGSGLFGWLVDSSVDDPRLVAHCR